MTILDARTGAMLDTKRLWEEEAHAWLSYIREIAFVDGLFTVSAIGGGDGITPILISVRVSDDGQISVPEVTRDWIWGFSKDRPICGAAWQDSAGGWMIAGFRR
jgi:hypothetical protein